MCKFTKVLFCTLLLVTIVNVGLIIDNSNMQNIVMASTINKPAQVAIGVCKIVKKATCTSDGRKEQVCSLCKTVGEKRVIKALGHNFSIPATCTKAMKCSRCQATKGKAIGHKWKAATCTTPKTCIKCKAVSGFKLGHKWKAATCTKARTCTICNIVSGEKLGHKWKEATCTTPKTCTKCKLVSGSKLEHKYEYNIGKCIHCGQKPKVDTSKFYKNIDLKAYKKADWTVLESCKKKGHKYYEKHTYIENADFHQLDRFCKDCKIYDTGYYLHSSSCMYCKCKHLNKIAATCETLEICANCKTTTGEALGHDYSIKATCTTPSKCSRCNKTEGKELGHDLKYIMTDKVYHKYKCTRCEYYEKDGHTCLYTIKNSAYHEEKCKFCEYKIEEKHSFYFMEQGGNKVKCIDCNATYAYTIISVVQGEYGDTVKFKVDNEIFEEDVNHYMVNGKCKYCGNLVLCENKQAKHDFYMSYDMVYCHNCGNTFSYTLVGVEEGNDGFEHKIKVKLADETYEFYVDHYGVNGKCKYCGICEYHYEYDDEYAYENCKITYEKGINQHIKVYKCKLCNKVVERKEENHEYEKGSTKCRFCKQKIVYSITSSPCKGNQMILAPGGTGKITITHNAMDSFDLHCSDGKNIVSTSINGNVINVKANNNIEKDTSVKLIIYLKDKGGKLNKFTTYTVKIYKNLGGNIVLEADNKGKIDASMTISANIVLNNTKLDKKAIEKTIQWYVNENVGTLSSKTGTKVTFTPKQKGNIKITVSAKIGNSSITREITIKVE